MSELLSIIIPVYKVEPYLKKCIDSVLSQTYTEFEIILVDDGSPDKCGEICDNYSGIDGRVKVIHKSNGGLSDARNAGIELAAGKYITFIDSDDWVDITYLEKLYNLIIETGADISVCNFIMTESEDIIISPESIKISEYTNMEILRNMLGRLDIQLNVAWGKLYRRELFEGIRYPLGMVHEDEATTYKLLYKAGKTVISTERLLYYRQRSDSIMGGGFNIKHKMDATDVLMEKAEFLRKIGLNKEAYGTYSLIFFIYNDMFIHKNDFDYSKNKRRIKTGLHSLTHELRKGSHTLKFKILYELYNLTPAFTSSFYNAYIQYSKNKKGR